MASVAGAVSNTAVSNTEGMLVSVFH
jgi:hypothetical protein